MIKAHSDFIKFHLTFELYFGRYATDVIEKKFFGPIDQHGSDLVDFFADYELNEKAHDGIHNLLRFIDAQKLRTPKGLDYLKKLGMTDDHQQSLDLMTKLWQVNCTIWMEGVWEIVSCDNSSTKFIISDHPVTTYNKKLFSGSRFCKYPLDASVSLLGTHTIFPLNLNRCLIITNLGYVRNPKANPLKTRENPRYFADTMFDLRTIQTGRQINEEYVLAINYVTKKRAKRYIAASRKEWLYPEEKMETTMWNKLGGKYFLMPDPRKVKFTTGVLIGHNDGSAWGQDEYGRRIDDKATKVKMLRDKEFREFERHKKSWDSKFGKLDKEDWLKYH